MAVVDGRTCLGDRLKSQQISVRGHPTCLRLSARTFLHSLPTSFAISRLDIVAVVGELPRCEGSGNSLFDTAVGAKLDVALPFLADLATRNHQRQLVTTLI